MTLEEQQKSPWRSQRPNNLGFFCLVLLDAVLAFSIALSIIILLVATLFIAEKAPHTLLTGSSWVPVSIYDTCLAAVIGFFLDIRPRYARINRYRYWRRFRKNTLSGEVYVQQTGLRRSFRGASIPKFTDEGLEVEGARSIDFLWVYTLAIVALLALPALSQLFGLNVFIVFPLVAFGAVIAAGLIQWLREILLVEEGKLSSLLITVDNLEYIRFHGPMAIIHFIHPPYSGLRGLYIVPAEDIAPDFMNQLVHTFSRKVPMSVQQTLERSFDHQ